MKSLRRRKLISARCFCISMLSKILLEEINRIFSWSVWTWEISPKKERVLLTNFRKLSDGCFLNKLCRTSVETLFKIEILPKPLRYHAIQEYKRFLSVCSVLRGASLSTFEIFDVAKGRKRAFCSFDYWELS